MKKLLTLIPLALALTAGAPPPAAAEEWTEDRWNLIPDWQRMELERRARAGDIQAGEYLIYITEQELNMVRKDRRQTQRNLNRMKREREWEEKREREARERELHRLEVRKREAELRQLTGQPADTGPPPARAQLAQQPARAQPAGPPAGRAHQMEPAGAHQ